MRTAILATIFFLLDFPVAGQVPEELERLSLHDVLERRDELMPRAVRGLAWHPSGTWFLYVDEEHDVLASRRIDGEAGPVRLTSEELEKQMIAEAAEAGMVGIKGHRSVGGIRTSIYNAMEPADVRKFVDFAKSFAQRNA